MDDVLGKTSTICLVCAVLAMLLSSCSQMTQQGQQLSGETPVYHYIEGKSAYIKNGKAVVPKDAPPRIKRAILAANKIVGKPYRRGGGHGKHVDRAYDCSGSVAYVLREAGMLEPNRFPTSGDFLRWGRPGFGEWLTVYTKRGHVFLFIAGLRFDTTGSGRGVGPRWYVDSRGCKGFYVRHIPGY